MKVFVEMDHISKKSIEYLSASYRDFVPEGIEIKEVIKEHLRVVTDRASRIREVTRGILNLEAIVTQPIRTYIEHQLEAGIKRTPAYFLLRERGLKVRKQTFLQYWHAIEEGWREEPITEEEEETEYDSEALTAIHEWLTKELNHAFGSWTFDRDYSINEATEFVSMYKTRTFEFGLTRLHPPTENYYFVVFNKNMVQSYAMWDGFDYMGFNREIRRIGAWK